MSLHIKTIETSHQGARLLATLSLTGDGLIGVTVRLTAIKRSGKEMLLGMAKLNAAGELTNFGSALNEAERNAVERAIRVAVG